MTERQLETADETEFRPLLEFDMDAGHIDEHWTYCDHIANFVARMVSHNRSDPFKYSNLLSTSLNELFETVYRTQKEPGQLHFCILRKGDTDRIELKLPCAGGELEFLLDAVDEIYAPDASENYLGLLFSEDKLDRRIGLFELAINYEARINASTPRKNTLLLTMDIMLNEAN